MRVRTFIKYLILSLIILSLFVSVYALFREDRRGYMTVAFLNIGQGDAIFIDTPNGNQVLIDGGVGRSVLRELSKVMPFYDRSIDVVIASHADQDHVGGLPDVFEKYKVDLFLETGVKGESSSYQEIQKILTEDININRVLVRSQMVLDLGGGVYLHFIFPDSDPSNMETNESSIIAKLVYGESEFLLTGDAPMSTERYLLSKKYNIDADVLKVGHHGSKTSTSDGFVKAVSPQYAVISSGKDNRYGHPHKEVTDILSNNQVQILRTDQNGRIVFESDGKIINLISK